MDGLDDVIGIGGQQGVEVVGRQPVLDLSDALPLRDVHPREEHQRFTFVPGRPGVRRAPALLFTGGIRFGKAGDRHDATALDT